MFLSLDDLKLELQKSSCSCAQLVLIPCLCCSTRRPWNVNLILKWKENIGVFDFFGELAPPFPTTSKDKLKCLEKLINILLQTGQGRKIAFIYFYQPPLKQLPLPMSLPTYPCFQVFTQVKNLKPDTNEEGDLNMFLSYASVKRRMHRG